MVHQMPDKYENFCALSRVEHLGIDYEFVIRCQSAPVAIIAPHGGKIEKGTSEIAAEIAGDAYNLYCFNGIKPKDNRYLHITSTHFDEPQCMALISKCDIVVAVHWGSPRKSVRSVRGPSSIYPAAGRPIEVISPLALNPRGDQRGE